MNEQSEMEKNIETKRKRRNKMDSYLMEFLMSEDIFFFLSFSIQKKHFYVKRQFKLS